MSPPYSEETAYYSSFSWCHGGSNEYSRILVDFLYAGPVRILNNYLTPIALDLLNSLFEY